MPTACAVARVQPLNDDGLMAKAIDLKVSARIHAGAVRLNLLNPEVLRSIALAAGAIAASATVEGDVTTIVRTIAVPESVQAIVKSPTIDVIERRVWQISGADLEITLQGLPVTMRGHLDLKETGEHCVVHVSGSIEARMSFMGPLVESLLRDRMMEAIRAEIEALR
jgi:hypothetical protein